MDEDTTKLIVFVLDNHKKEIDALTKRVEILEKDKNLASEIIAARKKNIDSLMQMFGSQGVHVETTDTCICGMCEKPNTTEKKDEKEAQ